MFRAVAISAILCTTAAAQPTVPSADIVGKYRSAIKGADPADPRSIEAAIKAIDQAVLGNKTAILPDLVALLARPVDKRLITAQVAAASAIPKLRADAKASVDALVPVLDRPFPKVGTNDDQLGLHLALAGAAVNALAKLEDPRAIVPTLRLIYRAPQLSQQARRAIVAYGPASIVEVKKLLRGQQAEINQLFKAEKLDQYCEAGACQPVSIREFYAAILAGDLYDPSLAEELLKLIKAPAVPAYIFDGAPGPTQHQAAFDALRKLGNPATAPTLLAMIKDRKTPMEDRTLAAATYAFVATDPKGTDELGKIAADNTADDSLRQSAADSFARLGGTLADIKVNEGLAKRYLDAAAKQTAEAATLKDRAKKQAEQAAATYIGYARMFQNHMARIELGVACKADPRCLVAALDRTPAEAVARMKPYIPDIDAWTAEDKQALWEATVDRGLIDLGKRGVAKPEVLDKLLAHAGRTERVVRQAILIALAKVAPRPCPACVTKLDAVIEADRTKSLGDLTIETALVRNYLRWAK